MPRSPFVYEILLGFPIRIRNFTEIIVIRYVLAYWVFPYSQYSRPSADNSFNMKFKEGTHFLRRLDQPSPAPPKCKGRVDCLLCLAPADSDDDGVILCVRRGAREGYRLDKLMVHYRSQHKELFPKATTTLLEIGFSRSAETDRNNPGMAEETAEIESIT